MLFDNCIWCNAIFFLYLFHFLKPSEILMTWKYEKYDKFILAFNISLHKHTFLRPGVWKGQKGYLEELFSQTIKKRNKIMKQERRNDNGSLSAKIWFLIHSTKWYQNIRNAIRSNITKSCWKKIHNIIS